MTILAVDNDLAALETLVDAIREAVPDAAVRAFQSGGEALAFAEATHCRVVFLEAELRGMHGLVLARRLQALPGGKTGVAFVTGSADYCVEALEMHADDYILKPVSAQQVRETMRNLYPEARETGGGR